MKYFRLFGLVLLAAWLIPGQAPAGDFDGAVPLLCATTQVIECPSNMACEEVALKAVGMPRFFTIDFESKRISPIGKNASGKTSRIENQEHIDGKLILQGAEDGVEGVRDGVGWTLAIPEDSGDFVLTASGDEAGFVVFGACTPQR
jgi:hypothetical protein